ncbi:Intraflagellar transport protein 80 -like protein [Echinococcus granulosus]|nr:Intraflagellar transport protein 80 -like protein [Echinococcus granulosus]
MKLWRLSKKQHSTLLTLPESLFPVAIAACPPKLVAAGLNKSAAINTFAVSSTDGYFHLVNKSGRVEKSVEAHRGAVLGLRWSYNGDSFATCGEDGQVKVWSRSGMLRLTLVQKNLSVYALAWGPKSEQIVHTSGKQLTIRTIRSNATSLTWTAHDGLILKVDWNPINDLLISGGEDCKYKVWDSFGRLLFSSQVHNYPICSLAWKPTGDQFAVGSYNFLQLCDKLGWSQNVQKPKTGSLLDLAWSPNGANLAAASGNGSVIFAHPVGCRLEWAGFEVVLTDISSITVTKVCDDSVESLQFCQPVLHFSLAYGHLTALTINQCYIYSVKNFNTPVIVDLKDAIISIIVQSQDVFMLVDWGTLLIYNYSGRLISSVKNASVRTDFVYPGCIALSSDTIATKDSEDEKAIHLFEANSGKPVGDGKPIIHAADVMTLGLNQKESVAERRLAILDRNKDLFIYQVRVYGRSRPMIKLGSVVSAFMWSGTQNFLAAIKNEKLTIWYYPTVSFVDKELLDLTVEEKNVVEGGGKYCTLNGFNDNHVTIRRPEGTIVASSISPYPALLYALTSKNKWTQGTQLCRNAKDPLLWACLAGLAMATRRLDLVEDAYAALNKADKVEHIKSIREMASKEAQSAQTLLLAGQPKEAERTLLQAGLQFSAVMLNLAQFKWERALELANKNELSIAIVLSARHHYLSKIGRPENIQSFLNSQHQKIMDEETLKRTSRFKLSTFICFLSFTINSLDGNEHRKRRQQVTK